MLTPPIAEFHDLGGSYVLVQPFDEVRCRVLASNVALRGDVLYKDPELSWTEATEDLGGYTRLGPAELLPAEENARPESTDTRDLLQGDIALPGDPLRELEDPRTAKVLETELGGDPRASFLRLAMHYQKVHQRKEGDAHGVSVCRCPHFAPAGDPDSARLHALVSRGILTKQIPSLPWILGAIRAVSRARSEVA